MGKTDLFRFEREAKAGRPELVIAGVDEAGRGPLAGPVVAAAVILPPEEEFDLPVNDSKALTRRFERSLERGFVRIRVSCGLSRSVPPR